MVWAPAAEMTTYTTSCCCPSGLMNLNVKQKVSSLNPTSTEFAGIAFNLITPNRKKEDLFFEEGALFYGFRYVGFCG